VALAEVAHGAQQNRATAAEDEDGRRGAGGDADGQKITPETKLRRLAMRGKRERMTSSM
jgi:hypothetical protein